MEDLMKKISVLIADGNRDFCEELKNSLLCDSSVFAIVNTVHDGSAALSECERLNPDVLLLDMVLPQLDGFEVLQSLRGRNRRINVIAMSLPIGDEYVSCALRGGAKYYMVKPINFDAIKRRILELYNSYEKESPPTVARFKMSRSMDERISNIFISVGIPAHIKGYHFLREAIKMAIDNPDIINSITKRLYPDVAERFDTSASKVERAIRHAIEVAWNKGKIENINNLFGIKVYSSNEKPTNGEFIALVADKMLIESA
ncbi:MAG: sporulation transcription factor Spo0A [Clostridia bacterium]|nr:sporulation transcription factor Spo0A [Clostridia bacterium]